MGKAASKEAGAGVKSGMCGGKEENDPVGGRAWEGSYAKVASAVTGAAATRLGYCSVPNKKKNRSWVM